MLHIPTLPCVFDFDFVDEEPYNFKETLAQLRALFKREAVLNVVATEGPGGGWPNVRIHCDGADARAVHTWLLKTHIAWSDEDGEIHDSHC